MNKQGSSLSLDTLAQVLRRLFLPILKRFTFIIWLTTIGLMIYALVITSAIIAQSDDLSYRESQLENRIRSDFDTATIEKIDSLSVSSDTSAAELPTGRRNPFTR